MTTHKMLVDRHVTRWAPMCLYRRQHLSHQGKAIKGNRNKLVAFNVHVHTKKDKEPSDCLGTRHELTNQKTWGIWNPEITVQMNSFPSGKCLLIVQEDYLWEVRVMPDF